MEVWKDIEGYEGLYQVSNKGRVKSFKQALSYGSDYSGKVLKLNTNDRGYVLVTLSKNMKRRTFRVHRLVAQAFIPNPKNFPVVNHIDENKLNNNVDNLEWCTQEYNIYYSQGVPVKGTNLETGEIIYFPSVFDTSRHGFSRGNVYQCCVGERKTHKGFVWEYATKEDVEVKKCTRKYHTN